MRELEREPTPHEGELPPLAIVGAGRVGTTVLRAAEAAGLDARLAGRDDAFEACRGAGAALLCVPDAAIGAACASIAEAVPPLRFVGHTSGATGLDALESARERGAAVFGLHPLQTIPDGNSGLDEAPCAVAGSNPAAAALADGLARRLGLRPFALDESERVVYHAAAAMAANFLVALEESAAELVRRSGVEDGRELLAPLVLRSALNWSERGAGALTGPIARGDEETVRRHVEAIRERCPELLDAYLALAERTREIAGAREVAA